jgi:hypothetical protein
MYIYTLQEYFYSGCRYNSRFIILSSRNEEDNISLHYTNPRRELRIRLISCPTAIENMET